jgi:sec-independent protein translocase protein TatA
VVFNIGPSELILVLVLALVVFGPKKLPEIGKAVGSGVKEFKRAAGDLRKSIELENETGTVKGNTSDTK